MKSWHVEIPITGYLLVPVGGADSEEEAIGIALDKATINHIEFWNTDDDNASAELVCED